jgi:hypothetical protein
MYPLIRSLALVAATGLVSGGVSAQMCPDLTRVFALRALLEGKTLCAASGSDRWQEQHRVGGELWDFKLGGGSTTDPTAKVGIWDVAAGVLIHTYDGGSTYRWAVCEVGANNYTLVSTSGGPTITGATVQSGRVACPL